jgi:hypothetical protein
LAANGCLVPGAPGVVELILLLEKSEDTTYVMKGGEERRTRKETLHAWREQGDGIFVYQIRSDPTE